MTENYPTGKSLHWTVKLAIWTCGAVLAVLLGVRTLSWTWGLLVGLFVTTTMLGQEAKMPIFPVATQPDSSVLKVAEAYRHAVLNADVARVMELYRDDAIEMPPFQFPVSGRTAIEQFYRGMFNGPARVTGFTFEHMETRTHGDVAYDIGTYKRTMSGSAAGSMEIAGTYMVLLKLTGAEWKVAYSIYNCDCPPPTRTTAAAAH